MKTVVMTRRAHNDFAHYLEHEKAKSAHVIDRQSPCGIVCEREIKTKSESLFTYRYEENGNIQGRSGCRLFMLI